MRSENKQNRAEKYVFRGQKVKRRIRWGKAFAMLRQYALGRLVHCENPFLSLKGGNPEKHDGHAHTYDSRIEPGHSGYKCD